MKGRDTNGLIYYKKKLYGGNMMIYDQNKVEMLRQRYPEGTRICLDSMENDPHPIPSGAMGTVKQWMTRVIF